MAKVERASQNCVSMNDVRKFEFPTFEPTDYTSYMKAMMDNDLVDRLVHGVILGNQVPDSAVERHDKAVQGFTSRWKEVTGMVEKLGQSCGNSLHLEFTQDGYPLGKEGLLLDGRIIRNMCKLNKAVKA